MTSSEFSILDGQDILKENCKFNDKDGAIRVFKIVNGEKNIIYSNIGTINYLTGKIVLESFSPVTYDGTTLDLTIIPTSSDVTPLREQIVLISESNINLTMNDVASVRSNSTTSATTSSATTTSTSSATTTSTSTSSSSSY